VAKSSNLPAMPTFGKWKDGVALSKKRVLACVLAIAAGLSPESLRAQGNVLVIHQHIRTNHLSAVVVDSTGAAIPQTKISIFKCPKGEFKGSLNFVPITETLADQQGRFSLPWPSTRVCLQAKSLGMNLLQIEVLRDPNAGELQVKLIPGT
jgi:hypothetical protein